MSVGPEKCKHKNYSVMMQLFLLSVCSLLPIMAKALLGNCNHKRSLNLNAIRVQSTKTDDMDMFVPLYISSLDREIEIDSATQEQKGKLNKSPDSIHAIETSTVRFERVPYGGNTLGRESIVKPVLLFLPGLGGKGHYSANVKHILLLT